MPTEPCVRIAVSLNPKFKNVILEINNIILGPASSWCSRLEPLSYVVDNLTNPSLAAMVDSMARWSLEQDFGDLSIHRSGVNLKIVLQRPQNGNALTTSMVSQLVECFRKSSERRDITRIIIAAQGKFFCTGMDLGKSTTAVSKGGDSSAKEYQKFVGLFRAIDQAAQTTIALINGPCYAGGIGLAFACDIRLAVQSASVTLSEVKLGLCPAIISKYLVREWGAAFAREAMLTGRAVSVNELRALGAIHGLASNVTELENALHELLQKLRGCAPDASEKCKKVVQAAYTYSGRQECDQTVEQVFIDMMDPQAESAIGVKNFQSGKRSMDWDEFRLESKSKL